MGKKEYGNQDILSADEAKNIYREWEASGCPKVKFLIEQISQEIRIVEVVTYDDGQEFRNTTRSSVYIAA